MHTHCVSGKRLKEIAAKKAHLLIYEDCIVNNEKDPPFKTLIEEIEPYLMPALVFPFRALDDATKAFNVTPNKKELLDNCPNVDPQWYDFGRNYALDCFSSEQLSKLEIKAESQEEADHLFAYVECIKGDFGFKAEDKWKVLGWLFSIIVPKLPKWA